MLQQKTEGGQQCAPADNLLLGAVGTGCPGLQQCCSQLCAQHLTVATVSGAATAVTASWVLRVVVSSDRVTELLLLVMLGCRQRDGPVQSYSRDWIAFAWGLSRSSPFMHEH